MFFRRLVSFAACVAILIVSFVGICTQMRTACGDDCHVPMVHSGETMQVAECATHTGSCAAPVDHMALFFGVYPSIATDSAFLVLACTAFVVLAWTARPTTWRQSLERRHEKRRKRRRDGDRSLVPDFLIFAFRHGVLHSKIYA